MAVKSKSSRKLERHFKGVANHRRIEMLLLIGRRPGIIVDDIVAEMNANDKTIGEHLRRLVLAGLVEKEHSGRMVQSTLTPYGEIFVRFIREFGNL